MARRDFGLSVLSLAADEVQGLLIIASFSASRDGAARRVTSRGDTSIAKGTVSHHENGFGRRE